MVENKKDEEEFNEVIDEGFEAFRQNLHYNEGNSIFKLMRDMFPEIQADKPERTGRTQSVEPNKSSKPRRDK